MVATAVPLAAHPRSLVANARTALLAAARGCVYNRSAAARRLSQCKTGVYASSSHPHGLVSLQLVNPPVSFLKKLVVAMLLFFVLFKLGVRVRITFDST